MSVQTLEGRIERVKEHNPQWTHIYLEGVSKPIAFRPPEIPSTLKDGMKVRVKAGTGDYWLFGREIEILEESPPPTPVKPHPDETYKQAYQEREELFTPQEKSLEEQNEYNLKDSISKIGRLYPILLDAHGNIIDGYHRQESDPNWPTEKLNHIRDPVQLAIARLVANVCRRKVPSKEKTEWLRQIASLTGWTPKQIAENLPVSYTWVMKYLPDEFKVQEKVEAGKLGGEARAEAYRKSQDFATRRVAEVSQITSRLEPRPLPEGMFTIIYADPPWTYDVNHLRGSPPYPTMTTEEICNLKIPVAEDAILFLWTTNPMLEDALKVMKSWGFKYKTNLVWVKNRMGVGFWFRGQHELLLVGVKGDVHAPEPSNTFPSVLEAPVRRHSEKPKEVYELIERMYPNYKYLELFARNKREGWVSWGNEV